jgi:hypothetical protein
VTGKQAPATRRAIVKRLKPFARQAHTQATDNGKGFVQHERIAADSKLNYYFAHPRVAWERGAHESLNGLVRQSFPKHRKLEKSLTGRWPWRSTASTTGPENAWAIRLHTKSSGNSYILTSPLRFVVESASYKVAEIYERFNLHACLNVIASVHLPGYKSPDDYLTPDLFGGFDDWNALKKRGHEVMPHSWDHKNLTEMPLREAKENFDRCLDYFGKHLEGFDFRRAVYNFAFNASTPELEKYALSKVRAIRTRGDSPINPIRASSVPVRLGCFSFGPANCDNFVEG